MIQLEDVTYQYPRSASNALDHVSLVIPEGQFCALLGANTAGKSTLAYTITGFVPHFYHGLLQGRITIAGRETTHTPLYELVQMAGLVFQNPFNQISGARYTVEGEIAFGLENLGVARHEMLHRIHSAMEIVGIQDLKDRSPMTLSGGQMQRVAIASVLVMQPRVLVLDEPTSQLDPAGSLEVFTAIRSLASQHGTTVVLIEHKLEWIAEFADRAIVLAAGKVIADGAPREILTADPITTHGIGGTRYTQAALPRPHTRELV